MELNSPHARSNILKAPEQPKVNNDAFNNLLGCDPSQNMQPHELGDNEVEPTVQELQHRIFMLEQNLKRVVQVLISSYNDAACLASAIAREFNL